MKIILGILVYTIVVQAQILQKLDDTDSDLPKSYPIHAGDLLRKRELDERNYIKQHPDAVKSNHLHKASAWGFTKDSSSHSWYADDLSPSGSDANRYRVPSHCRAVGTNCYVFVEDANWGTKGAKVSQAMVDSVRIYFDSKTPANPSKGIFETDTTAFGNPPDVDSDPIIIILLLDIKDGYSGSGGYVAGYFYSFNEIDPEMPGHSTSNNAEIFFIDVNPTNLSTTSGLNDAISTLAHEFQHMIHFNYTTFINHKSGGDLTFIDEGCSTLAEVNCGFPIYSPSLYAAEPNHYLFDWRYDDMTAVLNDYSRAARFFVYLRDQVGMGLFKPLVASTLTGTAGIDAGLQSIKAGVRFSDILQNWFVANMLNDTTVDKKYGYIYPNLPKPAAKNCYNPNVATTIDSVNNYAVRYISFKNSSQLKAVFYYNPTLIIKAIEIGTSSKRVLDVTSGAEFSAALYDSTYTEVDFVVMNTDATTLYPFMYRATGVGQPVELKYDVSEPIAANLSSMSDGDTVCVIFDAVQDGRLDSIRVALRRNTPITGGIWKYTGAVRPTPLGQPLATNLTVSGLSNPSVYPVPWNNWATIDLRSKNINTNSPFAVGFRIDGSYPTDQTINRVMITIGPVGNTPTSLTYSQNYPSGSNWYVFVSNSAGDSMYYYLIRAYVSFPATGVQTTIELNPMTFNLSQNYPNPFNPSTNIKYTIPVKGIVRLQVFDILGRSIATLVNTSQEAGIYHVTWDGISDNGTSVSSGVYFYRLESGSFIKTERMLLLK